MKNCNCATTNHCLISLTHIFHLFSQDVLTNHNCLEAFWVGNLKNRDLQVKCVCMCVCVCACVCRCVCVCVVCVRVVDVYL